MPVAAAYGLALDTYAAGNWTEAIRYLEASLRLCRLVRESARTCALRCDGRRRDESSWTENQDLRVYWRVLTRASCQKKCRAHFPALQLTPPGRELLEDFSRRSPYRYLHFAYAKVRHPDATGAQVKVTVNCHVLITDAHRYRTGRVCCACWTHTCVFWPSSPLLVLCTNKRFMCVQLNDLQRAVPCAFTFLQKNPGDQEMHQIMEGYKSEYDVSGYLTDYEELPYEVKAAQIVLKCFPLAPLSAAISVPGLLFERCEAHHLWRLRRQR